MDYGLAVEGRFGQCPKRPFAAGSIYCVFRSGRKKRFGHCRKRPFAADLCP